MLIQPRALQLVRADGVVIDPIDVYPTALGVSLQRVPDRFAPGGARCEAQRACWQDERGRPDRPNPPCP